MRIKDILEKGTNNSQIKLKLNLVKLLPTYIQMGNQQCYGYIKQESTGDFVIIYAKTTRQGYITSHGNIEVAISKMLDKLRNPPSSKYIIDLSVSDMEEQVKLEL